MKRFLALMVVALLMVGAVALAETPSLTLEEEKLLVVPAYGDQIAAIYTARVKNSGSAPLALTEGLFELKDKDGNVLSSQTWLNVFPSVLAPGEEAYVNQQEYPENVTAKETIDSHVIDLKASTDVYQNVTRVPATAEVVLPRNPDYEARMIYATITNDSGRDLYDLTLVLVFKDDQGNMLFADKVSVFNAGVAAGGELKVRQLLNGPVDSWLNTGEATLGTVEAYAYVEEYPEM